MPATEPPRNHRSCCASAPRPASQSAIVLALSTQALVIGRGKAYPRVIAQDACVAWREKRCQTPARNRVGRENSRPLDPQDVAVGVSARHTRSGAFRRSSICAGRPSACRPCGPQVVPKASRRHCRSLHSLADLEGAQSDQPVTATRGGVSTPVSLTCRGRACTTGLVARAGAGWCWAVKSAPGSGGGGAASWSGTIHLSTGSTAG
jgi:hypothetical protein